MANKLQLIKPTIERYKTHDERLICSLKSHNDLIGDLSVVTQKLDDGRDCFLTEAKNRLGKRLGSELFSMPREGVKASGLNICVEPEYRKKSFRLGELLRLSSIIEIMENKNVKFFEIFSKNSAIYFHSKYKFKPDIVSFSQRDEALATIAADSHKDFSEVSEKAKYLIDKVNKSKTASEQRDLCKETNTVIDEYITRALNSNEGYKEHTFDKGFNMSLSKEDIIENRDFYNPLFKRHGIDYEI